MDEELVNEAVRLEVVAGGAQNQTNDEESSLNPECHKILKPQDNLNDFSRVPPREYNAIRQDATSQVLHPSHFLDDPGDLVEELTVRSYNGSRLEIGTLSNRGPLCNRQKQWQLASDAGMGNSVVDTECRNSDQAISGVSEYLRSTTSPEILAGKSLSDDQSNVAEHLTTVEHKAELKDNQGDAHGGVRTKIISKSGSSEYFIKHTLKEKGIVCKGPSSNCLSVESKDHNLIKVGNGTQMDSSVSTSSGSKTSQSPYNAPFPSCGGTDSYGVTLREWLKAGQHKRSKAERLKIFIKIVDLVDGSHSQGFALHNLTPSYIKLLPSNQVMYLGLQKQMLDSGANSEVLKLENSFIKKRMSEQVLSPSQHMWSKKQKFIENVKVVGDWRKCPPRSDLHLQISSESKVDVIGSQDYCNQYKDTRFSKNNIWGMSSNPCASNESQSQLTSLSERWEDKWYASPEGGCTTSSNIYCLGVLFFELLGHFDSERAHIAAMSNLRHRILPQVFQSENPEEAGLCLRLLHPEPTSRPTTREILQSEVINGIPEVCIEELSLQIDQEDAESELLLHFLLLLKERKNKVAFKLEEKVRFLESDIEAVERRYSSRKSLVSSGLHNDMSCQNESASLHKEPSSSETTPPVCPISNANKTVMRNMRLLESAYFSMRYKVQIPQTDAATRPDKDILRYRENRSVAQKDKEQHKTTDTIGAFFDGFCKYARYCKFEVRGVLRNSDFNYLGNVISSLSFDRDEEYLAAAGLSKKLKIFEFSRLFNDAVDIHYPVVEMSNGSKLSCVCWNSYIKNYLASTDYDGVVKGQSFSLCIFGLRLPLRLWDAITGQVFSHFTEHKKRAWSVDFSLVYPTKLASGGDDYSVKLWSINERNCLGTIQNVANVCCVQFSAHSSHLLAFGSADNSTYCYDLRNVRRPWCVLPGHSKTVSYVKFLDSETLVSASTDNTLKIWDLNKTSPVGPSASACSLTLSGHTNEKNFVGLSVANGYIACGSENNEVYAYYRSIPMPITSHKFGSIDPIHGKETDDAYGQYVSCVCWKGKSDMVVVGNSSGRIKVLQIV